MGYEYRTAVQAKAQGYFALTRTYKPSAGHMMAKVLSDMERGDISVVLVRSSEVDRAGNEFNGLQVWRYRGY